MVLYAVVHDGTVEGNNTFYAPSDCVEYNNEDSLCNIKIKYLASRLASFYGTVSSVSIDDSLHVTNMLIDDSMSIKGAWVITEGSIAVCNKMWTGANIYGDKSRYLTNNLIKILLRETCVTSLMATKLVATNKQLDTLDFLQRCAKQWGKSNTKEHMVAMAAIKEILADLELKTICNTANKENKHEIYQKKE